jgi:hypothetical protein
VSRLAAFFHRRARRVLAGAVVFFFVAAAVGSPVAGQLTRTSRDFQDLGSESAAARDRIEAATGSEPGYGVVALVRPGWAPAPLRRLHDRIGIGEGPAPPQGAPA